MTETEREENNEYGKCCHRAFSCLENGEKSAREGRWLSADEVENLLLK